MQTIKFTLERLNGGKPLLTPNYSNRWEDRVVLNPACIYLEKEEDISVVEHAIGRSLNLLDNSDVLILFYRAQGGSGYNKSRLGLAIFSRKMDLLYRHPLPIVEPEYDFENFGVEDPRVSRFGDQFVMVYTGYSKMETRGYSAKEDYGRTRICMAVSNDLVHWTKLGPIHGNVNEVNNKNGAIFPDLIDNHYYMLHRPMAGKDSMSIHLARSEKIDGEWESLGLLMKAEQNSIFKKSWIGAGAPPIAIGAYQYLMLYHTGHYKKGGAKEYDIGVCKLSYDGRFKISDRIERLLVPSTEYERSGDPELGVNNTVFVCGAYKIDDEIFFPYAGSDSVILSARLKFELKP